MVYFPLTPHPLNWENIPSWGGSIEVRYENYGGRKYIPKVSEILYSVINYIYKR